MHVAAGGEVGVIVAVRCDRESGTLRGDGGTRPDVWDPVRAVKSSVGNDGGGWGMHRGKPFTCSPVHLFI